MNRKIESYLDVLFLDIPRSRKAIELREELSANMNDRMDDYLKEGKSENQAYSLVIANLGDVDELLKEVSLTPDNKKEMAHYRKRNAIYRTVAIMLYIIAPALLIALATSPVPSEYSVVSMLIVIAIATGLLVYSSASTPKEYANISVDDDDDEKSQFASMDTWRTYRTISSVAWSTATVLFLLISFTTFYWHITWIIFPITAVILGIFRTILQIKEMKHL